VEKTITAGRLLLVTLQTHTKEFKKERKHISTVQLIFEVVLSKRIITQLGEDKAVRDTGHFSLTVAFKSDSSDLSFHKDNMCPLTSWPHMLSSLHTFIS